jgi:hypothetical protein
MAPADGARAMSPEDSDTCGLCGLPIGLHPPERIYAADPWMHGHYWDVIETYEWPTQILCSRCGKSHRVVIDD